MSPEVRAALAELARDQDDTAMGDDTCYSCAVGVPHSVCSGAR